MSESCVAMVLRWEGIRLLVGSDEIKRIAESVDFDVFPLLLAEISRCEAPDDELLVLE